LPHCMISLYIYENGNAKKTEIAASRAVWVKDVKKDEIQNIIHKKEKIISNYCRNCDENWLLIVIEGIDPSSIIYISKDTTDNLYDFTFDKVLLFNVVEKKDY